MGARKAGMNAAKTVSKVCSGWNRETPYQYTSCGWGMWETLGGSSHESITPLPVCGVKIHLSFKINHRLSVDLKHQHWWSFLMTPASNCTTIMVESGCSVKSHGTGLSPLKMLSITADYPFIHTHKEFWLEKAPRHSHKVQFGRHDLLIKKHWIIPLEHHWDNFECSI